MTIITTYRVLVLFVVVFVVACLFSTQDKTFVYITIKLAVFIIIRKINFSHKF